MNLLRALVPSWRFFDKVGDVPRLYHRSMDNSGNWSEWTPTLRPPPPRRFQSLIQNPEGNLYLAAQSLIERFAYEVAETESIDSIEYSVSYALTNRLVQERLREDGLKPLKYQFMIRVFSGDESGELLVSREHSP